MAKTNLPTFPSVNIKQMRMLKAGEFVCFASDDTGKAMRTASSNVTRLGGRCFEFKTAAVLDPTTCQAVKVLFITRTV